MNMRETMEANTTQNGLIVYENPEDSVQIAIMMRALHMLNSF